MSTILIDGTFDFLAVDGAASFHSQNLAENGHETSILRRYYHVTFQIGDTRIGIFDMEVNIFTIIIF